LAFGLRENSGWSQSTQGWRRFAIADKFWDCEWPKPIKVIGSGSFGVTYVAKWHMAHVAMKVMKFDEANEEQGFASFFFEVDFHRMLHHPNVVDSHPAPPPPHRLRV
jgi:serine/threonine protein kinase